MAPPIRPPKVGSAVATFRHSVVGGKLSTGLKAFRNPIKTARKTVQGRRHAAALERLRAAQTQKIVSELAKEVKRTRPDFRELTYKMQTQMTKPAIQAMARELRQMAKRGELTLNRKQMSHLKLLSLGMRIFRAKNDMSLYQQAVNSAQVSNRVFEAMGGGPKVGVAVAHVRGAIYRGGLINRSMVENAIRSTAATTRAPITHAEATALVGKAFAEFDKAVFRLFSKG
jgi:hypothetical protein